MKIIFNKSLIDAKALPVIIIFLFYFFKFITKISSLVLVGYFIFPYLVLTLKLILLFTLIFLKYSKEITILSEVLFNKLNGTQYLAAGIPLYSLRYVSLPKGEVDSALNKLNRKFDKEVETMKDTSGFGDVGVQNAILKSKEELLTQFSKLSSSNNVNSTDLATAKSLTNRLINDCWDSFPSDGGDFGISLFF